MQRSIAKSLVIASLLVAPTVAAAQDFKARCEALAQSSGPTGRVTEAVFAAAGPVQLAPPAPPGATAPAPEHCLVRGKINERTGIDGKPYAIGYEVRLPSSWNGKFLFQGGGGVDGVLRPALGLVGFQATPPNPLTAGYAVASTDAGHLEEPGPIGPYLFGLDPQARADKGYNAIPTVDAAARALIAKLYGRPQTRAYFAGCSNGGRQAMVATQRYPNLYDGVLAAAPAYRVPLAAIEGMAHNQLFMGIAPKGEDGKPDMGSALTSTDLKLVADAILATCDAADGLKDGMVQNMAACKVDIAALACKSGQNSPCLVPEKALALAKAHAGRRNSKGELLYSNWPFDPGLAGIGWTAWRLGTPKASPPNARNMTLIPGSLAYDFMVPPENAPDLTAFALNFDFDRDAPRVLKGANGFESGMEFEAATNVDIDAYKARGGKILFTHGVADPIFSAIDTAVYYGQLMGRYETATPSFARLFLVPGMNHCAGGPSTDAFDALAALDTWVETNKAPDSILATARKTPDVPWPNRTRPLCPHPQVATYTGTGDVEKAQSFSCK
jgi:pimeloyl-ACP methyl ester carboxylesterase